MKKVTFKFIGSGLHPVHIKVLDNNMNIVYKNITRNKIDLCLEENNSYLVIARVNNIVLKRVICIDDKTNKFIFSFYIRIITFLLKDYYYNLPIKKGELILWQK